MKIHIGKDNQYYLEYDDSHVVNMLTTKRFIQSSTNTYQMPIHNNIEFISILILIIISFIGAGISVVCIIKYRRQWCMCLFKIKKQPQHRNEIEKNMYKSFKESFELNSISNPLMQTPDLFKKFAQSRLIDINENGLIRSDSQTKNSPVSNSSGENNAEISEVSNKIENPIDITEMTNAQSLRQQKSRHCKQAKKKMNH